MDLAILNRIEENIFKIDNDINKKRQVLKDINIFFKLPLDMNRLEDYQILDFNKYCIEIIDLKTKTAFKADCSSDSNVLGFMFTGNYLEYINISISNPLFEQQIIYNREKDKICLEELIIKDGDFRILLKKTAPDTIDISFKQDGVQFLAEYYKEIDDNNSLGKKKISYLTHVYKKDYIHKKITSFERKYINPFSSNNAIIRPDYFSFEIGKKIILGSKIKHKESYNTVEGACFEIIDDDLLFEVLLNKVPGEQPLKRKYKLEPSKVTSAILYGGYINKGEERYYHDLEITKDNHKIIIIYTVKDELNENIIKDDYIELPMKTSDSINIDEITKVISTLNEKYKQDEFIEYIILELFKFRDKLLIRDNQKNEIILPVSPKILIDIPFEQIKENILKDKEAYFRMLENEFKEYSVEENIKNHLKT